MRARNQRGESRRVMNVLGETREYSEYKGNGVTYMRCILSFSASSKHVWILWLVSKELNSTVGTIIPSTVSALRGNL
jgi:hypothetical protein